MKTYGQFCPIAQALEILAERWTLLVVRELLMGSTRFSELQQGVPLMSRTLLSDRLRSLRDFGLVEKSEGRSGPEYTLTRAGKELQPILESIGQWGKQFAHRDLPDEHLDPKLLLWDMHRRLHRDKLPVERAVVLFKFSDAKRGERRFWLCVSRDAVDVCYKNPGYDVDLTLDTNVRALTELWLGNRTWHECMRNRDIVCSGDRALARAFPGWLAFSSFSAA
jgi:DNA-binding HxlR family transcriptional regulator